MVYICAVMNFKLQKLRLRIFISVIASVFFSANVVAQSYTISPNYIDDGGFTHVKVIGQDGDGFYLLQSNLSLETDRDRVGFKSRKYKISYYDFNLKQKWNKAITPFEDGATVEAVTFFNEHVLVIQSQHHRDEDNIVFFADTYNNTGLADKSKIRLSECRFEKYNEASKLKVVTSTSKTIGALYFEEDADREVWVETFVFDSLLVMTSKMQLVIPGEAKRILETNYALSEQGDFAGLVQLNETADKSDFEMFDKFYKKPDKEKKRIPQYHLFVNRFGEKIAKEFPVSNENKAVSEAAIAIDNLNSNVVVAGFYADKNSNSGTGILYATVSLKSNDSLHLTTHSITGDAQIKLIGERNEEGSFGLFGYPIQRVILRADGGAVLVAEAAYTSEYSYYDYFTQSFTRKTEYHFDNVIVLSINALGTIDWTHVLRKSQTSTDDGGFLSSFISVLNNDKLALLYNSELSRNNEVLNYSMNAKGELNESKLISSSERIYILPKAGKQIDNETLIVPALIKKRMYLVKIKI